MKYGYVVYESETRATSRAAAVATSGDDVCVPSDGASGVATSYIVSEASTRATAFDGTPFSGILACEVLGEEEPSK